MTKVYGKINNINPQTRTIQIIYKRKLLNLHLSRRMFRDFSPYFTKRSYIFAYIIDEPKYINGIKGHEIVTFIKIVQNTYKKPRIFYDLGTIRQGVKSLLNRLDVKMFLDLEFTLPSYNRKYRHKPEIVQYGIVVEDGEQNIIFEDSSLVLPKKKQALNKRTLKFINKNKTDFDNAVTYDEFYNILKSLIDEYDLKIIAWGKNDILILEQSFELNNKPQLDIRTRYINLMQLMKNYYNVKNDLGLFKTYQDLSEQKLKPQKHDAFVDALLTREIYNMFLEEINNDFYN